MEVFRRSMAIFFVIAALTGLILGPLIVATPAQVCGPLATADSIWLISSTAPMEIVKPELAIYCTSLPIEVSYRTDLLIFDKTDIDNAKVGNLVAIVETVIDGQAYYVQRIEGAAPLKYPRHRHLAEALNGHFTFCCPASAGSTLLG